MKHIPEENRGDPSEDTLGESLLRLAMMGGELTITASSAEWFRTIQIDPINIRCNYPFLSVFFYSLSLDLFDTVKILKITVKINFCKRLEWENWER